LSGLKVRVPEDVELIGFGNDLEARTFFPDLACPFSTVEIPRADVGRRAAELLLERMQNPGLPIRKIVVPTRLLHRGTTRVEPMSLPIGKDRDP
ncbi:MAG: substrate-binding domain-containing protein, partial [Kiritimatiellae bacterium]|nr:substrate-binding domain-containing protein [Kiritimatiellia bacterium]